MPEIGISHCKILNPLIKHSYALAVICRKYFSFLVHYSIVAKEEEQLFCKWAKFNKKVLFGKKLKKLESGNLNSISFEFNQCNIFPSSKNQRPEKIS